MRIGGALLVFLVLTGCEEEATPESEPVRPVRVTVAQSTAGGETVRLTGDVRAQETVLLGFKTGGRRVTRTVNVGDTVEAGDLLARLEDATQLNTVQAAKAELSAAEGDVDRTETDYGRQAELLERGFTTRQRYDTALQVLRQAQSRADAARAQLANAQETLSFTALYADAPGVVTAVGAEPGEVVAAGAMTVQVARDNGRDAVFDVPERLISTVDPNAVIDVSLVSNPDAVATGRVREVAPEADPVTRTFQVRVGLSDVPDSFRLGSGVGVLVMQGTTLRECLEWATMLYHSIAIANGGGYLLDIERNKLSSPPIPQEGGPTPPPIPSQGLRHHPSLLLPQHPHLWQKP